MMDFPKQIDCGNFQLKLLPASFALAQEIFDIYSSDAENMIFWLPNGLPERPEDVLVDLVNYEEDKKYCMYYIFEDSVLLGQIGLSRIGWKHKNGSVGYWLKKSARGRGIISQLLPMIERLGFETFELRKLIIGCDGKNVSSRKIAEKNGYTLDAFCRQDIIWPDGTIRDNCEYSKLKSEWEKGKQK